MSGMAFITGIGAFARCISTGTAGVAYGLRHVVRTPVARTRTPNVSHPTCRKLVCSVRGDDELSVDERAQVEALALQVAAAVVGFFLSGFASPAQAVPEALVEGFKSIPASLVHPLTMWIVVGVTLYTFYLGYQVRQIRSVEPAKRKELVKAKVGERHFKTSSLLFAVVTLATFGGMANTYTRANKLFPGPHLYAGLGIIASMSVMASFVPYMQKGKDWARNSHFTVAFLVTGLFFWQAKSGMVIVGKLLGWE